MKKTKEEYAAYKRAYRAKKKSEQEATFYGSTGPFFMDCCLCPADKADKLGHGEIRGIALSRLQDEQSVIEDGQIFDVLRKFKSNVEVILVYVRDFNYVVHFLIRDARALGLRNVQECRITETNEFSVFRDKWGDYRRFSAILDDGKGGNVHVELSSFEGLIPTSTGLSMRDAYIGLMNAVESVVDGKRWGMPTSIAGLAKTALLYLYGGGNWRCGCNRFAEDYPPVPLEIEDDLRRTEIYRGGLNYGARWGKFDKVLIYDRRSLYPYIYATQALPFGEAYKITSFDDRRLFNDNADGAFYVVYKVKTLRAELKPSGVPCIQIRTDETVSKTAYARRIDITENTPFALDSNDYEMLLANYDVDEITIDYAYAWKRAKNKVFADFVNRFYRVKNSDEYPEAIRLGAKYILNSISGLFGSTRYRRETVFDEELKTYKSVETAVAIENNPSFLPIALFITSYGRKLEVEAIKACGSRYIYGDTDSVMLSGWTEIFETGRSLGDWGLTRATSANFVNRKTYYYVKESGDVKFVISGASASELAELTTEDFDAGAVVQSRTPHIYSDGSVAPAYRDFKVGEIKR